METATSHQCLLLCNEDRAPPVGTKVMESRVTKKILAVNDGFILPEHQGYAGNNWNIEQR